MIRLYLTLVVLASTLLMACDPNPPRSLTPRQQCSQAREEANHERRELDGDIKAFKNCTDAFCVAFTKSLLENQAIATDHAIANAEDACRAFESEQWSTK